MANMQSPAFDSNLRRKKILIKYTMLGMLAYAITQIASAAAYYFKISSIQPHEIWFVTAASQGASLLFIGLVHIKKDITTRFANTIFFGQFALWLALYLLWFLSLREIRSMALFCALMALTFLLSHARLYQSLLITLAATLMQIGGSYFAIYHLNQPGSFTLDVFYALCFLPSALFICNLSAQYAVQRAEVSAAKHSAEQSRDALSIETDKAHRLNAELQQALSVIQEISIRDVLTGLYNRRHLIERLEIEKKRADRTGQIFSIIILDIDHFKRINDTFGHLQGDEVLKEVARIMQSSLRETDFCARFGGEEFVMVLEQTSRQGALMCAERARRLVEAASFPSLGDQSKVTVSLGVTRYVSAEEISQTLTRADEALYRAKDTGRNRVEEACLPG